MPRAVAIATGVLASLHGVGAGPLAAQAGVEPARQGNPGPSERPSLEIPLDGVDRAAENRIAVIIGRTDLTSLFSRAGSRLVYDSTALPLPDGESSAEIYLVSPGNRWTHVASVPLSHGVTDTVASDTVASDTATPETVVADTFPEQSAGGFAPAASATLSLNASGSSERADGAGAARDASAAGTAQATLQNRVVHGPLGVESRFDLAGASRQEEALRFSERGDGAPQIDLSSYALKAQLGRGVLDLGHLSFGSNRHLINGFSSRGLKVSVPIRRRAEFGLVALNGSDVVGFGNFLGLNRAAHRIVSGVAGVEIFPAEPGLFRIEASALTGSLLPQSGFNQGGITDAEESDGVGIRVLAGGPSRRFTIDAGVTVSAFENPADPLLDDGLGGAVEPLAVRRTTDRARYLDVQYDLLRNFRALGPRTASLRLAARHERVDPLFRSVGTSVQADRLADELELTGAVGEVSLTAVHARSRDNLDDLATLLTTRTRRSALSAGVPLPSLMGGESPPAWVPSLTYAIDRTHQFGEAGPSAAGFDDPSFIPDQVGTSHTVVAGWQDDRWRAGYTLNLSVQDNRQPGRERADLENTVHTVALDVTARDGLDLGLDLSAELAENRESAVSDRVRRLGWRATWRVGASTSLGGNLSFTRSTTSEREGSRSAVEFDAQWSQSLSLARVAPALQGQFFLRVAAQAERNDDPTLSLGRRLDRWTVTTGGSITVP